MSETSRRNFLAAAGVGAASGAAVLGGAASASARTTRADRPGSLADEPVLAVVDDHTGGTLRLLVGEREVVVEDRDLVARLLRAAGGR